jgi:hypothetical protein
MANWFALLLPLLETTDPSLRNVANCMEQKGQAWPGISFNFSCQAHWQQSIGGL